MGRTGLATAQGSVYFPGLLCTAQAPRVFHEGTVATGPSVSCIPRSKVLRFSAAVQGCRCTVHFVPFPGPGFSGDQVLGEHTVPGGLCILCASRFLAAWFPGGTVRAQSQVCHVSPLGS